MLNTLKGGNNKTWVRCRIALRQINLWNYDGF